MKITGLKTSLVDVPLEKPIATAIHNMRSVGCVLLEIETDQGINGQSYVFTLNGVRLSALDETVRGFDNHVVGRDPHFVSQINQGIWDEMNPIGHTGFPIAALSAIDMACWDIIGKAANQPLHKVFGACRDQIKTYASGGLWLSQTIDECIREANAFIDAGFRSMKIRLGSKKQIDDIDRVRAIREAVGPDIELLTDANQGLTTKAAIRLAHEIEEFEIGWFEEPVIYQNLEGNAEVRDATTVPIAGGESEYTHLGMHKILEASAVDVLMPDLQRVGGFSEFRRSAALASAYHIPVSTHIFTEQSLCVAASEPNCISVEHMPWFSPLFNEPLELNDGSLKVPDRPGIGFTFNHEAVERYRLQ
jgi:L-alanine-DL-glutamate epimerase-like enolase superfamily enzyme